MKRLTERVETAVTYIGEHKNFATGDIPCELSVAAIRQVLDRLAAYEDTGLEPEDVAELKGFMQGGIHKVDDGWAHVQELLKAKQEGRLVVLPCKVGDRVYISGHKFPAQIEEIVIEALNGITFNWVEYDRGPEVTELWDDGWFTPDKIGETVFLTREEAEAALRG